jgi:hypothetical protein
MLSLFFFATSLVKNKFAIKQTHKNAFTLLLFHSWSTFYATATQNVSETPFG